MKYYYKLEWKDSTPRFMPVKPVTCDFYLCYNQSKPIKVIRHDKISGEFEDITLNWHFSREMFVNSYLGSNSDDASWWTMKVITEEEFFIYNL